jgi:hypothetical protein
VPASSKLESADTKDETRTVPIATETGAGHHRRDGRPPSGISTSSAQGNSASPGSHAQLLNQAAASPPGSEPGSSTSASTAYAVARPETPHQSAAIAMTQETRCCGMRVVSSTPITARASAMHT